MPTKRSERGPSPPDSPASTTTKDLPDPATLPHKYCGRIEVPLYTCDDQPRNWARSRSPVGLAEHAQRASANNGGGATNKVGRKQAVRARQKARKMEAREVNVKTQDCAECLAIKGRLERERKREGDERRGEKMAGWED